MLTFDEINDLGNIINTTWGKPSTPSGDYPVGSAPQYSIKAELVGMTQPEEDDDARLVVNYTTVVSFRYQNEMYAEKRRFAHEADQIIKDYVRVVKDEFKSTSGRALKLKKLSESDSVEIFHTGESLSMYTQRYRPNLQRGFYRYAVVFSIG